MEFNILYILQTLHTPFLDSLMIAVTRLGDAGFIWIVTGIALFCFKKTRKTGVCVLLSLAFGFLLGNVFLKNIVRRDRPCWIDSSILLLLENPTDFSFPSGHTLAAFEGAMSIFLYHRRWGIGAFLLAAFIGFSRMYLFVHFPTDVLAGALLGMFIAWAVYMAVERWSIKRAGKTSCFL